MKPLLEVKELSVHYGTRQSVFRGSASVVRAVDKVSFNINHGEVVAMVGESGCGKTSVARAVLGLAPITSGSVKLDGAEVSAGESLRALDFRRRVQMIFQDPFESLNPRRTIEQSLSLPLRANKVVPGPQMQKECARLLDQVGLSPGRQYLNRYPHQLSGGQRQRVGIARAIAVRPEVIVADEAVSALDISIRAQVLALMRRLQREMNLSYLFITHDLGVVRSLADRVLVMYLGRIIEEASAESLFALPRHPYTRTLLAASPVADPRRRRVGSGISVPGEVPSPVNPPSGCHFHTRCPFSIGRCRTEVPALRQVGDSRSACHRAEEAETWTRMPTGAVT